MAWFAAFGDRGVGVIARPTALDVIEAYFSIDDTDELVKRYDDVLGAISPDGFQWQILAQTFGVPAEAIEHFLADWDDHGTIIVGCVNALREARNLRLPLRFDCRLGDEVRVEWKVVGVSYPVPVLVEITIYAPQA